MTSKSKTKGNSYERDIAKYLTDTYQQTFVRIPTSGAYVGGRNQHRAASLDQHQLAAHKGDIQSPTGWKINIEVKNYADLPFHQLFTTCKQLDTWIDQLEQVSSPDDVDIIFMKITRKGQFVCVKSFPSLDTSNALHYGDYFIFSLDTFFKQNKDNLKNQCV